MENLTSYTLKGRLIAQGPIHVSYMGLDGRLPKTPHGQVFLNGGTLRGPIRKAALEVILRDVAKAKGLSLADMYMLGQGVDITRAVNNEDTGTAYDPIAELVLRKANPVLDLMGRWKLAGRLEVQPLMTSASNVMTAGQGVRHDQFERAPQLTEWLSEDDRDALLKNLKSAHASMGDLGPVRDTIKQLKKDYRAAEGDTEKRRQISEQIKEQEAKEKQIKEAREGSQESIKHPIDGYESIAPGSELSSSLRITSGTPIHLGLLLRTLAVFSETPRLGGHGARGFGEVHGEWTVYRRDAGEFQAHEIGEVKLNDLGFEMSGEELTQANESFLAAVPDMDVTAFLMSQVQGKKEA